MNTRHSTIRAQQRGIPPLIDQWLEQYGEERYDGHGGIVHFFSRGSIRRLEHETGREPVRRMWEYFDAYKVVSSHDGSIITIGRRYKHITHV